MALLTRFRAMATHSHRYAGTGKRDIHKERDIRQMLDRSSIALDNALAASDTSPSQRAARKESAVILADALAQLPDDYREVMFLRHIEGLSIVEVAERMNRRVDSVKKLSARAVMKIRPWLESRFE
jgi:RNA polymerase sigma-70 factor (ECF subfamily)